MVDNILDVLNTYQKQKKYADDEFIIKICDLIITHYHLEEYISGIGINNNFNGRDSRYLFTTNILEFNLYKLFKEEGKRKYDNDYYGLFNLMVLKTIFHEIEHANQELIKDTPSNSISRKLLILGDPTTYIKLPNSDNIFSLKTQRYFYEWVKYRRLYNKFYYRAPNERMAIIKSCIDMNNIMEHSLYKDSVYYDEIIDNNDTDLNIILSNYELRGEITNSPSLEYLYKLSKDNRRIILTDKSLYDFNMPIEDRVTYGLALSKDEYNEIPNIKNKLLKKIN